MPQNLLETLGKNPNSPVRHGQATGKPTGIPATAIADLPGSADNDMLAAAAASAGSASTTSSAGDPNATGTVSTTPNSELVPPSADPNGGRVLQGWTEESLVAEMKKAREEAKRSRLEKQDAIERLKGEYERKIEEIKATTKPLEDSAKELADLRAKEADKKRSIEERLADREARLADKESEISRLKDAHLREVMTIKAELENYKTEVNVQNQFYQDKLNEELNLVPDKFKDFANRMIKGCDSARESLDVLRDAKDRGLFKERQTVVSHATPGLENNARISSSSTKTATEENKKKMKSTEKIGEALKNINDNPIFRGKRF
jgi:hypothetical protein